ncbi:MAG: ABC transporter ATP-binding protein [Thermoplasmata archaeon]|nr:ABC transporter ATP-binding protein [Thermoplasmata archaeon]
MSSPTLELGREPLLRVADLTKVYHSKGPTRSDLVANDRLTLEVRAGEVVALLGPNGAGKSTFLRQLAGQLLPSSGSIHVAGIDLVADPLRAKRFLSVIPQESEPIENLTAEEHVRYFGLIKGIPRRDSRRLTDEYLATVGLTEHRGKLVRELSGGLKRRVLIAVALASPTARLLLLDEPTTGLDPEARRSVWATVDSLRSRGIAIVLTTHYIEEAEHLADRVLVIDHGRFVAQGTPQSIIRASEASGHLDVYGVERADPNARAMLSELSSRWSVRFRRPDHWRFDVADPFAAATVQELERLTTAGLRAALAPVSLEDAYLALVGSGGNGG